MKRWLVLFVLVACSCKKKDAITPVPSVSVASGAAPSALIASAGPSAAASAQAPSAAGAKKLAIAGTFAPGVTARAFALGSHLAVSQSSDRAWSVSALGPSKARVDLTAKLGAKRVKPNIEIQYVGGSGPDDAWINTMDEEKFPTLTFGWFHATAGAPAIAAGRYLAVGELRKDHWVALPSHVLPMYMYDETPSKLVTLRGKGDLPQVPSDVRLLELAFLGDGRVCGVGVVQETNAYGMWLWISGPTPTKLRVGVPNDDTLHVARGDGGECVVTKTRGKTTELGRLRGDALSWVTVDAAANLVHAAPNGRIWLYDANRKKAFRARLERDTATLETWELPREVPGCDAVGDVMSLVALADEDVWLLSRGACEPVAPSHDRRDALLHTEPQGAIDSWPPP